MFKRLLSGNCAIVIFLFSCLYSMPPADNTSQQMPDASQTTQSQDMQSQAQGQMPSPPVDQLSQQSSPPTDNASQQMPVAPSAVQPQEMQAQGQPSDAMQPIQPQNVQTQSEAQLPAPSTSQPSQELVATYDQLKWPDSIELKEGEGSIIKTDDPKIVQLSKRASQIADQLKDVANKLKETADKVNQEFVKINNTLDDFYQKLGFDEGKIKAMLK